MALTFYSFFFVAIGGAAGAMARFALSNWLQTGGEFPWGTVTANLLGCFVMGIVVQLMAGVTWFGDAGLIPEQYRLLFAVGFCGSFTTLSAMMFELSIMLERDEILYSFSYLVGTLVGGFACFYLGVLLARALVAMSSI